MFSVLAGIIGEFTLLEEPDDAGGSPSQHEQLLAQIKEFGAAAIVKFGNRPRRYITVYPRDKIHFPWRGKRVGMWRLEKCSNPLWLGDDNVIYRGEGPMTCDDRPDYCEIAEIERRQIEGLERVRGAILFEIGFFVCKQATNASSRNGAEI
jgi:hypothetical protein